MISIETVSVFVPASLALILTPGPDTFYVLSQAARSGGSWGCRRKPDTFYVLSQALGAGRRVGVRSACGISAGVLVHTLAAVIGLSALLRGSALAFQLVKYVGAAYLAGVAMLSGTIQTALRSRAAIGDWLRYGTGSVLVGFGLVLAVEQDIPS